MLLLPFKPFKPFKPFALVTSAVLLGNVAFAASCIEMGLATDSAAVMQLREAAQDERTAVTFRDRERLSWFVPLLGARVAQGRVQRLGCMLGEVAYWKLAATDPALQVDSDTNVLSFLDTSQVTDVIDARPAPLQAQSATMNSVGLNYQLALNYAGQRLSPSALGDLYAYTGGWYLSNSMSLNSTGKIARFETYALRESRDNGTFLRLGDATSYPTPLGESLQFAGLSWGTDRNLRPGDFAPVLPTLRSGNVLAGPMEVFINDTLQFQQTLQNGVHDLRNIPAQNGFNSYTVRTLDVQGNAVTVQREIYLPASLLPPGTTRWRLDTGFKREDFAVANARYGAPFAAGSYATGVNHDVTVGGYALISQSASTLAAEYDQRLSSLWTGHVGLITASNTQQQGQALQTRLDGGSRYFRLLAEWTHAFKPLPSLGSSAALVMQRLVRTQWDAMAGWNFGLTLIQSQRELAAREDVAVLTASTRIPNSGASVAVNLIQTQSGSGRQNNLTLSLFVPLASSPSDRSRSIYASQSSADGLQLSRLQYNSTGQSMQDSNWSLGATRGSQAALSSVDGVWTRNTDKLELLASGRASQGNASGQLALRSGLLWTGGSLFRTRPITGAFAMVSTGEEGVDVYYENRLSGRTDARGLLLVPNLLALEPNHLSVNPATWPIEWVAQEVDQRVIPPRGGGVLVSFKINANSWPAQTMMRPVGPTGQPFAPGTVVRATVDGDVREAVIDRNGQLWMGELLPATAFSITQAGQRCEFSMPAADDVITIVTTASATIVPQQCKDLPRNRHAPLHPSHPSHPSGNGYGPSRQAWVWRCWRSRQPPPSAR